ncbi:MULTISPECIES: hypothetical protein [Chryseobacterium]|uniref:hypothetical protein n=1 Tax=Chryseobacterium TaxID=59732 RepID=UPI002ECFD26F
MRKLKGMEDGAGRWKLLFVVKRIFRPKNPLRKKQTLCFLNLYNFQLPSPSFQLII